MVEAKKIHVYPVKEFFIHTITKDVDLTDCVLDLLDNCIDGAIRVFRAKKADRKKDLYKGFEAHINLDKSSFSIQDNCGGIPLDYAVNYAFYFGRRPGVPSGMESQIGLYGIGMKRAIFKIGKTIEIETSAKDIAYRVMIDVPAWQGEEDWDFEYEDAEMWKEPGTRIVIKELNEDATEEFGLQDFRNRLMGIIARDYSFFLQRAFRVTVNGEEVPPYEFKLRESKEFKPIKFMYKDDVEKDVVVQIAAGMADVPLEDESPETVDSLERVDYYGWFVACNDRIVLAGDKTVRTGWGHNLFTRWHPQYNGFMGIVNFVSKDPAKLPWTTTKRALNAESLLYRRALTKMKEAARSYVAYTGARRADLEKAREIERKAEARSIALLEKSEKMVLPQFEKRPRVQTATIQYRKPRTLVLNVAESLGNRGMSYRDVGIETFDYYVDNELEEE